MKDTLQSLNEYIALYRRVYEKCIYNQLEYRIMQYCF